MKTRSILILCAMAVTLAHAQYEIPWHTMDGGGGTSAGGVYEVTGTIGQPDVGKSTGGDYELVAGFWAFAFVIQTDDGPQLMIRYLSPTEAELYWEAGPDPALLQRSADLMDGDGWEDDPGTPVIDAEGFYRLTVTPSENIRFYRLRKNE